MFWNVPRLCRPCMLIQPCRQSFRELVQCNILTRLLSDYPLPEIDIVWLMNPDIPVLRNQAIWDMRNCRKNISWELWFVHHRILKMQFPLSVNRSPRIHIYCRLMIDCLLLLKKYLWENAAIQDMLNQSRSLLWNQLFQKCRIWCSPCWILLSWESRNIFFSDSLPSCPGTQETCSMPF